MAKAAVARTGAVKQKTAVAAQAAIGVAQPSAAYTVAPPLPAAGAWLVYRDSFLGGTAVTGSSYMFDAQVAQFQGRLRRHSSNASVTPSAIRLMPIASVAIAPAGKIVDHQTPLKMRL